MRPASSAASLSFSLALRPESYWPPSSLQETFSVTSAQCLSTSEITEGSGSIFPASTNVWIFSPHARPSYGRGRRSGDQFAGKTFSWFSLSPTSRLDAASRLPLFCEAKKDRLWGPLGWRGRRGSHRPHRRRRSGGDDAGRQARCGWRRPLAKTEMVICASRLGQHRRSSRSRRERRRRGPSLRFRGPSAA